MKASIIFTVVAISLLVAGGYIWRMNGETIAFSTPPAVKAVPTPAVRKIQFLNHLPVFGWYSPKEINPTLEVGTIIEVDLSSRGVNLQDWTLRVDDRMSDDISRSFFLSVAPSSSSLKGAKSVTLRVKNNNERPSDAIHQTDKSGEWFWVREFYDCEIVSVS